jgi:hypothetical protein
LIPFNTAVEPKFFWRFRIVSEAMII